MYANDTAYTDQSMANVTAYLDGMLNGTTGGSGEETDKTGPTISLQTNSTENTVVVTVSATDESGLAESETYTYFLDNVQQGEATTENMKEFTGLQPSTEYTIKVIVKDALGNVAEKEEKVSTTEPEIPDMEDAKPTEGQDGPKFANTTTIQDDLGNSVVIPGGFHLDADSGTKVEEGIVIEDDNGNQFVWIPTGTYNVTEEVEKITEPDAQDGKLTNNLARRSWGTANQIIKPTEITADNGDGVIEDSYYGEGSTQYTSIAKNQIEAFKASASPKSEVNPNGKGGFYIGRYEQGTGNVCKAGVTPYTQITIDTSKNQAEAMYKGKNNNVVSELISSYAWDTTLNFICQTNIEGYTLATTNSNIYGNIGLDSAGTGSRKNTGVDVNDNYSNIHDLIGNCREWTTESSSDSFFPYVNRGGHYFVNVNYAADRSFYSHTNGPSLLLSFRVQLYIQ